MMMAEALRDLLYGRELTEALMAEDLERATLDSPHRSHPPALGAQQRDIPALGE